MSNFRLGLLQLAICTAIFCFGMMYGIQYEDERLFSEIEQVKQLKRQYEDQLTEQAQPKISPTDKSSGI